jgi:uncharacterized protein (DUF169 family)
MSFMSWTPDVPEGGTFIDVAISDLSQWLTATTNVAPPIKASTFFHQLTDTDVLVFLSCAPFEGLREKILETTRTSQQRVHSFQDWCFSVSGYF